MPPYALVFDILPGAAVATGAGSAFSKMIMPHNEWRALDACAAPGNKTSLLAALLQQSATAFDSMFCFHDYIGWMLFLHLLLEML